VLRATSAKELIEWNAALAFGIRIASGSADLHEVLLLTD
jgi:hypothetical protein